MSIFSCCFNCCKSKTSDGFKPLEADPKKAGVDAKAGATAARAIPALKGASPTRSLLGSAPRSLQIQDASSAGYGAFDAEVRNMLGSPSNYNAPIPNAGEAGSFQEETARVMKAVEESIQKNIMQEGDLDIDAEFEKLNAIKIEPQTNESH